MNFAAAACPSSAPRERPAMLETSKTFAKRFMQRHNIPTAKYAAVSNEAEALESLELFHLPVVVKADGLASGKGVLICETKEEAEAAITGLFSGKLLGTRSKDRSSSRNSSRAKRSLSFSSQTAATPPASFPAQDHKRIGEGDIGLNTGGMGVYTTDSMLAETMQAWLVQHVAQPTIDGMAAEGHSVCAACSIAA